MILKWTSPRKHWNWNIWLKYENNNCCPGLVIIITYNNYFIALQPCGDSDVLIVTSYETAMRTAYNFLTVFLKK